MQGIKLNNILSNEGSTILDIYIYDNDEIGDEENG